MPSNHSTIVKRAFAQSTYITAAWTWFMILAGKAAEPVLVISVLYASVKLLPIVHFPPQADVVVFIAQFVALDVGGLSLNKLADQAKKDGNDSGATAARRLSIALVAVMLIGVIMAGVDQIVRLEGQVATVVDTILLIARAVLAVLYSRVIHSLKKGDEPEPPSQEELETLITEKVNDGVTKAVDQLRQDIVTQLEATLSERFAVHEARQGESLITLLDKALQERLAAHREPALPAERLPVRSRKVRSITEARKRTSGGELEIDKVIWPLLNTGMTVRAIAAEANTSTATVGRSRQRWEKFNQGVSHAANGTASQET